jgi:hypothetical protein
MKTVQSRASSFVSPATISGVLTATIAAVILVVLYALNQRYFAMKCLNCGRIVSIRGKATFMCDRCYQRSLEH